MTVKHMTVVETARQEALVKVYAAKYPGAGDTIWMLMAHRTILNERITQLRVDMSVSPEKVEPRHILRLLDIVESINNA